jgi:hypothetical protein
MAVLQTLSLIAHAQQCGSLPKFCLSCLAILAFKHHKGLCTSCSLLRCVCIVPPGWVFTGMSRDSASCYEVELPSNAVYRPAQDLHA